MDGMDSIRRKKRKREANKATKKVPQTKATKKVHQPTLQPQPGGPTTSNLNESGEAANSSVTADMMEQRANFYTGFSRWHIVFVVFTIAAGFLVMVIWRTSQNTTIIIDDKANVRTMVSNQAPSIRASIEQCNEMDDTAKNRCQDALIIKSAGDNVKNRKNNEVLEARITEMKKQISKTNETVRAQNLENSKLQENMIYIAAASCIVGSSVIGYGISHYSQTQHESEINRIQTDTKNQIQHAMIEAVSNANKEAKKKIATRLQPYEYTTGQLISWLVQKFSQP